MALITNQLLHYALSPQFSPRFPCTCCGKPGRSYRGFARSVVVISPRPPYRPEAGATPIATPGASVRGRGLSCARSSSGRESAGSRLRWPCDGLSRRLLGTPCLCLPMPGGTANASAGDPSIARQARRRCWGCWRTLLRDARVKPAAVAASGRALRQSFEAPSEKSCHSIRPHWNGLTSGVTDGR